MLFKEFLQTPEFTAMLGKVLASKGLEDWQGTFVSLFKRLADKEFPSDALSLEIENQLGLAAEFCDDLAIELRAQVMSDYKQQLDQENEEFFSKRKSFEENFNFGVLLDELQKQLALSLNFEFDKAAALWFIDYFVDTDLLDLLTKPTRVRGFGLDEESAEKLMNALKFLKAQTVKYRYNAAPKILEYFESKGVSAAQLMGPEVVEALRPVGKSIQTSNPAKQTNNQANKQTGAATAASKTSSSNDSLESLLDDLSKDL
jgi:hypothetical protein